MKKYLILLLLPVCLFLSACSNVLNNTGISTYYTDSNISFAILQQLKQNPALYDKNHIVTTVYQNNVLIAGQVLQPGQRIQVQQIVQNTPGVKQIYNELEIAGPSTTLTRSSDSWITSKVWTDMVATKNLTTRHIKVVTENGIVYLMGSVSQEQMSLAINVARQVPGVQKVVNLMTAE